MGSIEARVLFVLVALTAACGPQRIEISLLVRGQARGNVESGTIRAFDSQSSVCQQFSTWGSRFCAEGCDPADRPRPEDELARLDLVPDENGEFGRPELELGGGEAWQVLVELTANGLSLYGCGTVTAGEGGAIEMLYPACEGDVACSNNYHPACDVALDCNVDFEPEDPACSLEGALTLTSLEERGRPCDPELVPDGGLRRGTRCRYAEIECTRGVREPIVDGVCPVRREEPCARDVPRGYDPEQDYDCDRSHPSCLEACDPATDLAPLRCGSESCAGQAFCLPEGVWSECTYSEVEVCDGVDNDCDTRVDEADVDSLTLGCPADETCTDGACACGGGPACGGGLTCCGSTCVNLLNDARHCGGCGRPCDRGQVCQSRSCADVDAGPPLAMDGGLMPLDAGPGSDAGPPPECFGDTDCTGASDRCVMGRCVCGTMSSACGPPEPWCCSGVCANLRSSQLHCGRCDRPCRTCNAGTCFD